MKKRLFRIILIVAVLFLCLGIFVKIQTKTNPRVRILMNTINFTEKTLKNPAYLFYDVDVMKLFGEYFNSDTRIQGEMSIYDVKKLGFSFAMEVDATRSFGQRKMESVSSAKVLGIDAGTSVMCMDDETIYLIIPDMDLSFAFPTGMDLFPKMPDLTHDINREWFHQNKKNIFEFTGQIKINQTGNILRETNGEKSDEFLITIPKGTGQFMWDLLGMDMPDFDVKVSMYLNPRNELRRMEIDLSEVMDGGKVVLDGTDVGTLMIYSKLPDGEKMHLVITRDTDKKNTMKLETVYDTNKDVHYNMVGSFNWVKLDNGFKTKMKELEILHGDEVLAKVNFNGTVERLKNDPEFFKDLPVDLDSIKKLDWRTIRDDVEGFTSDIMAKLKEVRKNK